MINLEAITFAQIKVGQVFRESDNMTSRMYRKESDQTATYKVEGVPFSMYFDDEDIVFVRVLATA